MPRDKASVECAVGKEGKQSFCLLQPLTVQRKDSLYLGMTSEKHYSSSQFDKVREGSTSKVCAAGLPSHGVGPLNRIVAAKRVRRNSSPIVVVQPAYKKFVFITKNP